MKMISFLFSSESSLPYLVQKYLVRCWAGGFRDDEKTLALCYCQVDQEKYFMEVRDKS